MKKMTRAEFLRPIGVLIFGFAKLSIFAILAYFVFLALKSIQNITTQGWIFIFYVMLALAGIRLLFYIFEKLIEAYKEKYGDKARVNIYSLSVLYRSILVSIFAALATKSFYEEATENVVIYTFLFIYILYIYFRDARKHIPPE